MDSVILTSKSHLNATVRCQNKAAWRLKHTDWFLLDCFLLKYGDQDGRKKVGCLDSGWLGGPPPWTTVQLNNAMCS
eukprot:1161579-Pelagomonas_calceolata.AAC.16